MHVENLRDAGTIGCARRRRYSKSLPADWPREDFASKGVCYRGLGLDVVVEELDELEPLAGDEASAGVEAAAGVEVVVVFVELELLDPVPPAGEGFTIVV